MIIGLTGKIGAGKTTVAEYLINECGFVPLSFADTLKDMTCVMFGCNRADLENQDFKMQIAPHTTVTYRHIMQTLGTEWGRQTVDENIWVSIELQKAKEMQRTRNVLFTDVRFDNEAEAIVNAGGYIFDVVRTDTTNDTSKPEHAHAHAHAHASEQGINKSYIHTTIYNNMDGVEKLNKQIQEEISKFYYTIV